MVLKRKRSESEISTTSSLFSSPPHTQFTSTSKPSYPISSPALFSSRTRKRYRDNRPSEDVVHQRTLSILFNAQQQSQPQHQSTLITAQSQSTNTITSHPPSQRTNLHSFWVIPSQPRPVHFSSTFSVHESPLATTLLGSCDSATTCEDCNACLDVQANEEAVDVDMMAMDVDERNFGCVSCGKQVCHACAVSNLGKDRRCLNCAKPKVRW